MKAEIEAKLDLLATKIQEAQSIAHELAPVSPPVAQAALYRLIGKLHELSDDSRAAHASGELCEIYEDFKDHPVWPVEG